MKKGLWLFGEEKEDTRRRSISKKQKTKKSKHKHEYVYFIHYMGNNDKGCTQITEHKNYYISQKNSNWVICKLCKECGKSEGWSLSGFLWWISDEEFLEAMEKGIKF